MDKQRTTWSSLELKAELAEVSPASSVVLISISLLVCLLQIQVRQLWGDEAFSLYVALSPDWKELISRTANDVHPPLYYIFLRIWVGWFGITEAALRSLSLVQGLCYLILLYLLGKRMVRGGIGFWPLFFVALSPYLLFHFINSRMYTQLILLEVLSLYCAFLLVQRPGFFPWMGFVLSSLAAVYTHYLALIYVGGIIIGGMLLNLREPKKATGWAMGGLVICGGFIAWTSIFADQHLSKAFNINFRLPSLLVMLDTINPYSHGPESVFWAGTVIIMLLLVSGAVLAINRRSEISHRFLLLSFFLTLSFFTIASCLKGLAETRYFIILVPFLAMMCGIGINRLSPLYRWGLGITLFIGWALLLPQLSHYRVHADWISATRYLEKNFKNKDVIIVVAPYLNYRTLQYYAIRLNATDVIDLEKDVFPLRPGGIDQLDTASHRYQRWFMLDYSPKPETRLKGALRAQGLLLKEYHQVTGIDIYLFEKAP